MKIPLTQGKFAIVGPRDYTFLMQWEWCYAKDSKNKNTGYAVCTDRTNDKQTIWMHRVILERMGFKNFARSDHINRNRLDNRRCNLRPATSSQSNCNQGKRKDNTSDYTGVYWCQRKWHVQIQINGRRIFLGCYVNKLEAAKAYDKAALKYHGKFAVLNGV